jgi:hypothetical protein
MIDASFSTFKYIPPPLPHFSFSNSFLFLEHSQFLSIEHLTKLERMRKEEKKRFPLLQLMKKR